MASVSRCISYRWASFRQRRSRLSKFARSGSQRAFGQIACEVILTAACPEKAVYLGHVLFSDESVWGGRYKGDCRRQRDDVVHWDVRHNELSGLRMHDSPPFKRSGKFACVVIYTHLELHAIEMPSGHPPAHSGEQVTVLLQIFLLSLRKVVAGDSE